MTTEIKLEEKKRLIEQIRYWKNKFEDMKLQYIKLDNYVRGLKDAMYYLGRKTA